MKEPKVTPEMDFCQIFSQVEKASVLYNSQLSTDDLIRIANEIEESFK